MERLITDEEIKESENYVNNTDESILGEMAYKMNQSHPDIASILLFLEEKGLAGDEVDEAMLIIFTIWNIYVNIKKYEIKIISEEIIESNLKLFISCIDYFDEAYKQQSDDIDAVKYLADDHLEFYVIQRLIKYYESFENIPDEVLLTIFPILKSFENNLQTQEVS